MSNKLRNLILLLIISFLVVLSNPNDTYSLDQKVENEKLELAPLNEEFLDWLKLPDDKRKAIPAPRTDSQSFISSYTNSLFGRGRSIVEDVIIPAQYDLRNVSGTNYTTPIKDQGMLNMCWTYAATTALESSLKKDNQGTYIFNPIHTNYVLSNKFLGGTNNPYGMMGLNAGGNFEYTNSYWGSGLGPVTTFSGNGTSLLPLNTVYGSTNNVQVEDTYMLPSFNNDMATVLERQEYNNIIKKQIMENGGIYFHAAAPAAPYYNSTYDTVYTDNPSHYINAAHAMVIIGWDDNYARTKFPVGIQSGTRPTNNGAWIVQNSWGTGVGDNGYFYYSYEDYMIGDYMMGVISASPVDYDNLYQYNPTGLSRQLSGDYAGVIFNKEDLKTENLTEVSFYVNEPNMNYEIYVNPIDGGLTGDNVELVYTSDLPVEFTGYHTVNLNTPIELKGKEFAVIVHFISDEYYLIPVRENSHSELPNELVGIMPEQNYASADGVAWNDLYYSGYNISLDIKAYTEDVITLGDENVDTTIKNNIVVIDAEEPDNVIGVNSITKDFFNSPYLTYRIFDAQGDDITSDFSIEKNPIIDNHTNATITVPAGYELGNYTLETYFNNSLEPEVDYFVVTDTDGTIVTDIVNKLSGVYIELGTTKDLSKYIDINSLDPIELNWMSNNPSIVSISDGIITGLSAGNTSVTVTSNDGLFSDTIFVTVNEVVEISTREELYNINNDLDGSYRLVNDIDISGAGWASIGISANRFRGTFDGNGYVIRGLNFNSATHNNFGLFGFLSGATITNVTLVDVNVTGQNNIGALAGYSEFSELDKISIIDGTISGNNFVGGIGGYVVDSYITKSFNAASVSGNAYIGGIGGYAEKVGVTSSYNKGNITGNINVGGGIGGLLQSDTRFMYNRGNVNGNTYSVGGLVGYGEDFSLNDAYNTGTIYGNDAYYIGGVVGFGNTSEFGSSIINNTYNVGNIVDGGDFIGGIFGASAVNLEVTNNYDIQDSIPAYGETGYADITNTFEISSNLLKTQITFVGFDFANDWMISTDNYPTLRSLPVLTDIIVSKDVLNLELGDYETITVQFVPETVLNKMITWESSNEYVATVDDGLITAIGPGNATITVRSNEGDVVKNIAVTVESPILSEEYTIMGDFINNVTNETTMEDFVSQIEIVEAETTLKIYESDGSTEHTEGIIGTNMILETNEGGSITRFNIVVKGDITGDGYVRVNDIIKVNNHIIGSSTITDGSQLMAADVTKDSSIRVNDIVKINNYIINPLTNPLIEGTN